ncbi:MAG: glycosyltransferase family 4 protein [Thermomicrobiales bacterium]|nr:glycosyltransferase family 4 protein [Thermomicrobiales bacterium]
MRIAIDGQFRSLPPSGTGAYLDALLRELPVAAPDDEFLVVDRPDAWGPSFLPGKLRRDARLLRFQWEISGFGSTARRLKPDLLHIPSFAAPLRTSIPFVVTIHDAIPFSLPEYRSSAPMRAHLALMQRTTRRATLVLTPSQAAADDLHRLLTIPRHRIRVTPEAADATFRPLATGTLDERVVAKFGVRGAYIFNVGGLDVRKRVDLLIEAFAAARPDLPPDTQLVIGGRAHSGNPVIFPDLAPLIERLGLRDAVVLTGWLSDDEKLALYQGAAIYATPSIYEGFGLTPLEAMACGTPVIAADRTSFPEVVGDAGLLVEPTVDAWRAALIDLMNNDARRAVLARRGVERAATFSWRRTAEQTLEAYREAIAISRRG